MDTGRVKVDGGGEAVDGGGDGGRWSVDCGGRRKGRVVGHGESRSSAVSTQVVPAGEGTL